MDLLGHWKAIWNYVCLAFHFHMVWDYSLFYIADGPAITKQYVRKRKEGEKESGLGPKTYSRKEKGKEGDRSSGREREREKKPDIRGDGR